MTGCLHTQSELGNSIGKSRTASRGARRRSAGAKMILLDFFRILRCFGVVMRCPLMKGRLQARRQVGGLHSIAEE
jgi:hypothetical protein